MGENVKLSSREHLMAAGMFSYIKSLLMLLRVAHWAKNLFLFIPLFFAGELLKSTRLFDTIWGFFSFCFVASGVYILNDYKDLEKDRLHPVKSRRSLASGKVSLPVAFSLMMLCTVSGLILGWYCGPKFLLILLIYLVLNIAYSFGLKNISILDILILASCFILRVKAGGVVAQVGISQWLMVMVFLLALFLALAKRRDDILLRDASGQIVRQSITGYNVDFLNTSLSVVSAVMIMAYLMYTLSPEVVRHMGTYRLYYTTVFVIAGLMRYLQMIYIKGDTRSPTRILYQDRFIQICIVLWMLSFYLLLYFPDFHFYQ